jgi:hypothetical protein
MDDPNLKRIAPDLADARKTKVGCVPVQVYGLVLYEPVTSLLGIR